MIEKLTKHGRLTLNDAALEARHAGSTEALPEHLLLALTRDDAERNKSNSYFPKPVASVVLERLGVSLPMLRADLLQNNSACEREKVTQVVLSLALHDLIQQALREAEEIGGRFIGSEHLLLALLRNNETASALTLARFGVHWQNAHEVVMLIQDGK